MAITYSGIPRVKETWAPKTKLEKVIALRVKSSRKRLEYTDHPVGPAQGQLARVCGCWSEGMGLSTK